MKVKEITAILEEIHGVSLMEDTRGAAIRLTPSRKPQIW